MKIDDYKLLQAVAETGTVGGAAKELLISQPAISQRLKQIENQWDVQIFVRTHKKVMVTQAGEKIIAFAAKIIKEEEKLADQLAAMSSTVGGTLSLGISSMVAQYVLPSILESFIAAYPDVRIELTTGLSENIENRSADFHITVVRGKKPSHGEFFHLFSDPLVLIDRKNKRGRANKRPLIAFQSDDRFHRLVNDWFLEHPEQKPDQTIKVDQIETCKQLMSHGLGTAVLPETSIQNLAKEDYKVHRMAINHKPLTRETWVCYSEHACQLPQVKAFLNTLKKHGSR